MREVVGLSLEKDTTVHTHTHTHTQAHVHPTYIFCVCVLCVWGILLTGCQVQPAFQNLCGHLLLPVWPLDTQIYTSMHVCTRARVCVCLSSLLEVILLCVTFFCFISFFKEMDQTCMQDLSLCRHPPRGNRRSPQT